MRIIIKNVNIITMNENMDEYPNGFVVIEKDKIIKIGHMSQYEEVSGDVIDGKQGILMPGMINTHTHLSMIPFRSLGDDCKDRLRRYLFPLEKECMNKKLAHHAAKYAVCELLLGGVTTLMDMYYFEDEVAKVVEEMGIRGFLGETVVDFVSCDTEVEHGGLAYAEEFIKKWKDHELITPFIAPHAPNTNSEEALTKANEISEKYQVPITMHVSEMDYELNYFRETYQQTPIEFLESIGLLSDRLVAAHCIFLSQDDIKLLKKYGVGIAHCIGSNTKAAKGVAPIKEALEAGISVGLGTDGASSGNTLDILTQFKLFANFHKVTHKDRSIFPAKEIVKLGTNIAAKVLHQEDRIGSIDVGKQADLTLLETRSVNMFPVFDPYSAVVYSANASNVDTVFVNGKCAVRDKQLVHVDLDKVRNELMNEMKEFEEKAKEYMTKIL